LAGRASREGARDRRHETVFKPKFGEKNTRVVRRTRLMRALLIEWRRPDELPDLHATDRRTDMRSTNFRFGPLALLMLAGPMAAQAAMLTVQATGTVTSVSPSLAAAVGTGSSISVTLTFDPDLAPAPSFVNGGEAFYQFPASAFAMTANVNGFAGSSTGGSVSVINQFPNGTGNEDWFQATSLNAAGVGQPIAGLTWRQTTLTLKDLDGAIFNGTSIPGSMSAAPFDIVLMNMFFFDSSGQLAGSISSVATNNANLSISPVPLPAAAWLLISGLGGLGALARFMPSRRKQADFPETAGCPLSL
jgi:hypothetical protein